MWQTAIVLAITDGIFKVVATISGATEWQGQPLDGYRLRRPAALHVRRPRRRHGRQDRRPRLVRCRRPHRQPNGRGGRADPARRRSSPNGAGPSRSTSRCSWSRRGVLLVILYAYFSQAARAQAADRIYLEAHQRIDLALVRGRCGLWDWDMVRGKMYWSRSMYDMLGYQAHDTHALLRRGRRDHPRGRRRPVRARQPDRVRARSTRSTRCSACATPTASGSGCAPAPR